MNGRRLITDKQGVQQFSGEKGGYSFVIAHAVTLFSIIRGVYSVFLVVAMSANPADGVFYSSSRLFSPQSITRLSQEVDELYRRFQKQATLDQLYYPACKLKSYKLVSTLMPFEINQYFSVPPLSS